MATPDNKLSYSVTDDMRREFTLSVDQDEWVRLTANYGGQFTDEVTIGLGSEQFERLVRFWRKYIRDDEKQSV